MNVLIDLRALQSGTISGVEVYVENLTRQLIALAPQHTFFLWTNARAALPENFPEFSAPNIQRLHTNYSNLLFTLRTFCSRGPQLDILLAHEWARQRGGEELKFDFLLVPDPRPAPVSAACKKIILFHDLSPFHCPANFSLRTRLWHFLVRFGTEAREASHILTPSHFTKEDLQLQWHLPEQKITVIGAGVSEMLRPITDAVELAELRKKYELPEKFLLTLSTLEPRKNLGNLLEAFQRVQRKLHTDDLFLVIAGKQNHEIFARLNLPTSPFVIFPGFIAEADKPALFSAALAFLYPSRFEGFGLPVLEALSCGTPVISSSATALPEVYGDAALSFDPENIAEISESIEQIFLHPDIRTELSRKGLERAHALQFSWRTVAEKVLAVLAAQTD